MLKLPKVILFDWDNTLVNTWPIIFASLTRVLETMGYKPWSEKEALERSANSLKDYFPDFFGEDWEEAMELYYSSFESLYLSRIEELKESSKCLEYIKNNTNIQMAVISNKKGHYLRAEATKLGWNGYFKNLVGAGDALRDKPDGSAVEMALMGTGAKKNLADVWIVGDSHIDMECAHKNGCVGIFIESNNINEELLKPYRIAKRFESCLALKEFIENNK